MADIRGNRTGVIQVGTTLVWNKPFDRRLIENAVGKQQARVMSKAGAFIMTRAKRSIRYFPYKKEEWVEVLDPVTLRLVRVPKHSYDPATRRYTNNATGQMGKDISPPGKPPRSHKRGGYANLRNIVFGWDPRTRSVVIGPVRANMVAVLNGNRSTVPALHEFGGTSIIEEISYGGKSDWFRHDRRRTKKPYNKYRRRTARYPARPFMRPAMEAEAPKFPTLWRNAVTTTHVA